MKLRLKTILCALGLSMGAFAQGLDVDSCYVTGQLDNGLKYYIRSTDREPGRADFQLVVKAGSLHESESQSGLAHFLEHIAFDGSKHFPGKGIINYCESVGVKFGENLNAHTYNDRTTFELKQVPVHRVNTVDSCLLVLSDFGGDLVFTPEAIAKERGVINEEWRMRSDVSIRLGEEVNPILLSGSRYAYRMPLGKMEVINSFDPKELEAYYHTWYRPNLEAVIVVGDVDAEHVVSQIKKQFGAKQNPKDEAERYEYIVPDNDEPIYITVRDKDVKFANLNLYFKNPIYDFDARNSVGYIMRCFLCDVVSKALNMRLAEMCEIPGSPLKGATAEYDEYQGTHTCMSLTVKGTTEPSRDAEANRMLAKAIKQARTHGFLHSELQRAVLETMDGMKYVAYGKMVNSFYVDQCTKHFVYNNPLTPMSNCIDIISSNLNGLEDSDFNAFFNELAHGVEKNFVSFGLYPDEEDRLPSSLAVLEEAVREGFNAETEPYVDHVNESFLSELPTPVKIAKEENADFGYKKWKLSNGANVYYMHTEHAMNTVNMCARRLGGQNARLKSDGAMVRVAETRDSEKVTLFDFICSLSLAQYSQLQVEKMLLGKNVALRGETKSMANELNGACVPHELRTLMEMTHLWFKDRNGTEAQYERAISNMHDFLQQISLEADHVFVDSVSNTVHPNAPRLKLEDLDNVSYEQFLRIYQEYFGNVGDYDFYFTGNFDEDSLRAYVEQYIAPLPGKGPRQKYTAQNISHPHTLVENHFSQPMQTPISWIAIYLSADVPYNVKNELVGRAMASALNERYTNLLREQKQMVYAVGAGSFYEIGNKDYCTVAAKCPVKPEMKDEALALMLAEMDNIGKNGITESELKNFKEFESKRYKASLQSNDFWEEAIVLKNDWGYDEVTDFEKILDAITVKDVQNFASDVLLKKKQGVVVTMKPE